MEWTAIVVFALLGGVIGCMITKFISRTKPIGTLRVVTSDSDDPYLFLELDKSVEDFYNESCVTFKVSRKNYISQD